MIRPKYKKTIVHSPFCPNCGEKLKGNNSIALPFKCSCGTWEPKYVDNQFGFDIKKK